MKNMNRNDQILKMLLVPISYPSKIELVTLDLYKKYLILLGVRNVIFLYGVYFVNSLISREHFKRNICRLLYNALLKVFHNLRSN